MPKYKLIFFITLLLAITAVIYFGVKSDINILLIQQKIKSFGIFAPLAFILLYSIVPVLFIPITPLSILAGIIFGPVWGTIYTVIGSTTGACNAFLISRYLLKEWIDKKSPKKVEIIQQLIKKDGWKFLALARISPIFPFNVQNYLFGMTELPLGLFALVSAISLIPGSFIYVYLGFSGKRFLSGEKFGLFGIIIVLIILILSSLIPFLLNKYRRTKTIS